MRARARVAMVAAGWVLACASGPEDVVAPPPAPLPPPTPSYVVSGTITDEAGLPMPGVTIWAPSSPRWISAYSSDQGEFALHLPQGQATIYMDLQGYLPEDRFFLLTADVHFHVTLHPIVITEEIRIGEILESEVLEGAPPCDRFGWDFFAPCRRYRFVGPATGRIRFEITWPTVFPELDLTMISPDGNLHATSFSGGDRKQILETDVAAGAVYEVRVNSYTGGQRFTLRAIMVP